MAGWTEKDLKAFRAAVHPVEGINVIGLDNSTDLINYLNSKDTNNSALTNARKDDKITSFTLFSHGLITDDGTNALGYYLPDSDELKLTKTELQNLDCNAFASYSVSMFYACNIGTSGINSFAQEWANITKGVTWAYVSKSNF